jgi:hypothetical protein
MKIRVGYELIYDFPQPTPMIMVLGMHMTRASDVIISDSPTSDPVVTMSPYIDAYGNRCSRLVAPAGRMLLSGDGLVRDSGLPDVVAPSATQHAVEDLPPETIIYLLGSRYCRRTVCPTSRGSFSPKPHRDGHASRQSAITSTITSPSDINTRGRPRPPARLSTKATACAATTLTWRSPSAVA